MKEDNSTAGAVSAGTGNGAVQQHTPGPWVIRSDGDTLQLIIMSADVKIEVASIYFDYHPEDDEPVAIRKKADARLIAAAPEMHAALTNFVALIATWRFIGKVPDFGSLLIAQNAGQAALAKAAAPVDEVEEQGLAVTSEGTP